jgi:shikimate dehydrogenase
VGGGGARLAVLGSPISHSRSPRLHEAAYHVLGLDWSYEAIDVTAGDLPGFVSELDESWRGLSLTMPLKRDILPLLDTREQLVELTGAANTVLFDRTGASLVRRGFNTDVFGLTEAFIGAGLHHLDYVHLLGAGATAASVLVAVRRLGAQRVLVTARNPERARGLLALGAELGMETVVQPFEGGPEVPGLPDVVVSTLPGKADVQPRFSEAVRSTAVLFDIAYDPWPSALALSWDESGGMVIPGLEMLLQQALAQVRIFVGGLPELELPNEREVLNAMRTSIAP